MGFVASGCKTLLIAASASAGDQRLVFELLKWHLCLGVAAIAIMIDLDDYIFGSKIWFYQGIPVAVSGDVMSHHVYRSH
jgi:hypothetical protein